VGYVYSFSNASWLPTAQADTTAMTNAKYMALKAPATPAMQRVTEVFLGGENTGTNIGVMVFGRHSTDATTPTALAAPADIAALNISSVATARGTQYTAASTGPQRSVTSGHLLTLSGNFFGGIIRWFAAPGGEIYYVGGSAPNDEVSLSGFTNTTAPQISSHVHFEDLAHKADQHEPTVGGLPREHRNHRAIGTKARWARQRDEWRGTI